MSGQDYTPLITAAEQRYNLPPGLLKALIWQESRNNPAAVSPKGAKGLGQLMPGTAHDMGVDPNDPAQNIDGSGRYLRKMLDWAGGNVPDALRAYNGGQDRSKWNNAETQAYPGLVLGHQQAATPFTFSMADAPAAAAPATPQGFTFNMNDAPAPAAGSPATPSVPAATPTDAPMDEKEFVSGLPGNANPGDAASQQDKTTAAVNDILKNKGGAPEIQSYFAAQNLGVDPKAVQDAVANYKHGVQAYLPFHALPPPTTADNLGTGLDRGLRDVAGTVGDAAAWADQNIPGAQWLDNKLGAATGVQGNAVQQQVGSNAIRDAYNSGPYANSLMAGAGRLAGNIALAAPLVMGGEAAAAPAIGNLLGDAAAPAMEFAAGRGGANLGGRLLSMSARGITGGAEYAAASEGGSPDSLLTQMAHGAEAGGLLAPAVGGVGGVGSKLLGLSGGTIDPARAALAQTALDAGIPIDLSQVSTSPFIRRLGGMLPYIPGSGMAEANAAQGPAFTRAISNTFGEDSPALTAKVMQNARDNIGGRIEDIGARNTITDTDQLVNDLGSIESNAHLSLPDSDIAPVKRQIDNIMGLMAQHDGTLPGTVYNTLISKNGPLDKLISNNNGALSHVGTQLRGALDDALESNIPADEVDALRAARLQYKNLMTVKDLAAKSPDGVISPALLQNKVTTNFKNRAFSGAADLGDLGDIGQTFLKPPNSSGTAQNSGVLNLLMNAGKVAAATGGALVGSHTAGDVGAGIGALASGGAAATGTGLVARLATKALTNPARVNKLVAAALNDNNAGGTFPALAKAGVPLGSLEFNRLRQATLPK